MASGQTVEAEHPTLRLVEPRPPMDSLGPLRDTSRFGSPLWQSCNREGLESTAGTPVGDIGRPAVPDGREPGLESEVELVAAVVGCDPPTQRMVPAAAWPRPDALARRRAIDPDWRPSPWPRAQNVAAPTAVIRLADLLGTSGDPHDRNQVGLDTAADPRDADTVAAAFAAAGGPPGALNARTLILAGVAALMLLGGGALFGAPMTFVTIAPSADAPHVSSAAVLSADLRAPAPATAGATAASPATAGPATTFPSTAGPVVGARDTGAAANPGIPGMMGTPVPVTASAPGQVGMPARSSMPTALSLGDG